MANPEHLRILERGVKAWNKWRKENSDVQPDLSGAYLSGAKLSRVNLTGVDLSGGTLREANLYRAKLAQADLSGANLRMANLREADLNGANLIEADLSYADLSSVNLRNADLAGLDLSRMKFCGADLGDADLSRTNLSDADFTDANLSGTDLSWANLTRANLSGADLSRASVEGVDFRTAMISGAILSEANLSNADLRELDLSWMSLRGTNLSGADLGDANLSNANLRGANLRDAILVGAYLEDADLSETNIRYARLQHELLACKKLSGADLRGMRLRGANFSGADLRRADLRGAHLSEADLSRADLAGADLHEADIGAADVQGANLRDANWQACSLVKCNLSASILTGAKLYGTSRDDWIIKDVKCDYIFWDREGKQRSPKDRDLQQGEFERLYAVLPTIEYIFEHGMSPLDPLIMDRVVQAIREKRPEFDIKIDSINARGLAPSIKFTVQHEEHKDPALEEVRIGYEIKLKQLESERDRYWELIKAAFDKPREVKLISAGPGAIVATDGSTVNIQQHIHNALDLQKAIAAEPEESKSFAKVAKKTALDIIGEAIKDVAKGQVKQAAKQIIELGKDLGPIIVNTAAYGFFRSLM